MRRNLPQVQEPNGEIDLTPMLDVVFIMLIFFIVTATFIKEPGIEINRPVAVTSESIVNQSILIAVSKNNDIWIDKSLIQDHQIKAKIEALRAENPKGAVVIQADAASTADKLALVIDAAKQAGAVDISLATSD